jgi:prepilin-type N-terminal cleavage/methylation domain-containing protein
MEEMMTGNTNGFTLVELLVVVAIIALLTSLLTPALEQAAYQAQLARCAGQLRTIGTAATHYAMDHAGWYIYNPAHQARQSGENWLSTMISRHRDSSQPEDSAPWPPEAAPPDTGQGYPAFRFDMRPLLKPHLSINKTMLDPLMHEPLDLEQTDANSVHANYVLRFGWVWRWDGAGRRGAEDGAFKLNQRFTWSYDWDKGVPEPGTPPQPMSFSVIASDFDRVNPVARGSHPDKSGKMWIWRRQDVPQSNGGTITHSLWIASNNVRFRGLIDMNFAYQDLSVQRFVDVEMRDDRMARVPIYNRGGSTDMTADSEAEQIPRP